MKRREMLSAAAIAGALSSNLKASPKIKLVSEGSHDSKEAVLVSPRLCGCAFRMTARWLDGAVNAKGISYQFPVPYTIESVGVESVCDRHRFALNEALPADPYFGCPGYIRLTTQDREWTDENGDPIQPELLDPKRATPAQKLFIHHFRYTGQVCHKPCGCKTYQSGNRADAKDFMDLAHPKHTRVCKQHRALLT